MNRFMLSLALAALSAVGAQAQSYPTRPATVIVPFAAGGPADITGRIVADIFSRHLGQQFVVENVGGAGGTTGSPRTARPAPAGSTPAPGPPRPPPPPQPRPGGLPPRPRPRGHPGELPAPLPQSRHGQVEELGVDRAN